MANITLRESTSLQSTGATVKGSPLTNNEVDNNFSNLNIAINELSGITSEKSVLILGDSWLGGDNVIATVTSTAARTFQRNVHNRAVGGRTSVDVYSNLVSDVAVAGGYENIALVVLGVGGNDKLAANTATISAANTKLYSNLRNILSHITANGVPVVMSPAPMVTSEDMVVGSPPDNIQFDDTGMYYDDPEYGNIAMQYPGVAVATNAMSYLINHPTLYIIDGGFHPTNNTGAQTYVNIISAAAQGLTENVINAAVGQTFDLLSFNTGLEMGRPTSVNTPYLDFHTSGNVNVDYDARIIANGGNGTTSGTGNLVMFVNTANVIGNIDTRTINVTDGGSIAGGTVLKNITEQVVSLGTVSTNQSLNLSLGSVFTATLAANNLSFTFTNPPSSGVMKSAAIILTQGGSGSYYISVTNGKHSEGTVPVLSTGVGNVDVLTYFTVDGGSNWYGSQVMADVR